MGESKVYVTYTLPQFDRGFNLNRSVDEVPGFIYFAGSVAYEKDSQGNIIVRNKSGGEA